MPLRTVLSLSFTPWRTWALTVSLGRFYLFRTWLDLGTRAHTYADSKALSAETRQNLWESFDTHAPLCYSSYTISPQAISAGMLRRIPINLNRQAEDATIALIQSALDRRIPLVECYVDALGPAPQWQARLSAIFPTVKFTVCPKADSLFKIVGAASIVAKVTRDRYIEGWRDWEDAGSDRQVKKEAEGEEGGVGDGNAGDGGVDQDETSRGSGYPSDPKTQAYLRDSIDPVFGYKGAVRFSWATVKVLMEKQGVECKWYVCVLRSLPTQAGCRPY